MARRKKKTDDMADGFAGGKSSVGNKVYKEPDVLRKKKKK